MSWEIGQLLSRTRTRKRLNSIGLAAFKPRVAKKALTFIARMSGGDARVALSALEFAVMTVAPGKSGLRRVDLKTAEEAMQKKALVYDKAGEEHYNIISALHKSLRGSDPDAALYWLGRMLEAGEDPLYIARRLIRFASEDIGMADPQALVIATSAQQAVHFVGMPEADLALAQAVVYLATAPKSNSLYKAYSKVKDDVARTRNEPVPLHLRNPETSLMRRLGYGKGYKYPHEHQEHFTPQQYLPRELLGTYFYDPSDQGYEIKIADRLERWREAQRSALGIRQTEMLPELSEEKIDEVKRKHKAAR